MDLLSSHYVRGISLKREEIPSFNQYPFNLPSLKTMDEVPFHPKVTFLIGENGMGKSTLLEAVAVALGFNAEGGSFNFNFSTFDSHSVLGDYLKVIKGIDRPSDGFFLRAESFYNVASNIEEMDREGGAPKVIDSFGGRSLHEQSHGEAFFSTFLHRFRGNGIYILDEPEAALSPLRQMSMLTRIHDLVREHSQFIIATHSPIIMAYPEAAIYEFSEEGISEKKLEETNHYRIMKQFFDDKKRMLHHLLDE
ncbi:MULTISPECIES: AAA family ATPase [Cytobacillus]|jgi:predicted ATPase|uniref:AAA family ATPase n=1 Tax=Cytobacillus oceanisediminis 2691 TaxID=1196031 RepID=A0A160M7X9_9BACI|nr:MULTISPECIES: AAA family ATPase [Cytobacillus]EFV74849.1 ABC transporter [Bacillus sp. 2_A_57_CT2]MBY0155900.1 AAA family ATPase [Cytobacillus firmus]AND38657.1 AAA family ATPase [Cytobacillus oceanisediminis 2691]MBU8729951.1 AAA family ATPase [Cytobacillus oceanisediminis]MCM3390854.1 AAA family ATPase [Cytobacillus oceanisediminis]